MKTVGQFIRERRGEISINQLSKVCGVNIATISRIENEIIRTPSLEVVRKILDALMVPYNELFREVYKSDTLDDDPAARLVEEELAQFPRLKLTESQKRKLIQIVRKHLKTTIPSLAESLKDAG